MSKKVAIGAKPTTKQVPLDVDAWVAARAEPEPTPEPPPEPPPVDDEKPKEPTNTKRLTIDVSVTLHRAIKAQCAMRGTKIADEVRELLKQKYGNT
jgi:hypothetical protein